IGVAAPVLPVDDSVRLVTELDHVPLRDDLPPVPLGDRGRLILRNPGLYEFQDVHGLSFRSVSSHTDAGFTAARGEVLAADAERLRGVGPREALLLPKAYRIRREADLPGERRV